MAKAKGPFVPPGVDPGSGDWIRPANLANAPAGEVERFWHGRRFYYLSSGKGDGHGSVRLAPLQEDAYGAFANVSRIPAGSPIFGYVPAVRVLKAIHNGVRPIDAFLASCDTGGLSTSWMTKAGVDPDVITKQAEIMKVAKEGARIRNARTIRQLKAEGKVNEESIAPPPTAPTEIAVDDDEAIVENLVEEITED